MPVIATFAPSGVVAVILVIFVLLVTLAERQKQQSGRESLLGRYMGQIRILVMAFSLVGFPVVGYLAGSSLAG